MTRRAKFLGVILLALLGILAWSLFAPMPLAGIRKVDLRLRAKLAVTIDDPAKVARIVAGLSKVEWRLARGPDFWTDALFLEAEKGRFLRISMRKENSGWVYYYGFQEFRSPALDRELAADLEGTGTEF